MAKDQNNDSCNLLPEIFLNPTTYKKPMIRDNKDIPPPKRSQYGYHGLQAGKNILLSSKKEFDACRAFAANNKWKIVTRHQEDGWMVWRLA